MAFTNTWQKEWRAKLSDNLIFLSEASWIPEKLHEQFNSLLLEVFKKGLVLLVLTWSYNLDVCSAFDEGFDLSEQAPNHENAGGSKGNLHDIIKGNDWIVNRSFLGDKLLPVHTTSGEY